MYVFATPMCVWRRHATRHRRCKGVKVVGRRASPRRRKNYGRTKRALSWMGGVVYNACIQPSRS